MFPTGLNPTERRLLLESTRRYADANRGRPGSELFQAEVLWLAGKSAEAEKLLRASGRTEDVGMKVLALSALSIFLRAENRDSEAEDVDAQVLDLTGGTGPTA